MLRIERWAHRERESTAIEFQFEWRITKQNAKRGEHWNTLSDAGETLSQEISKNYLSAGMYDEWRKKTWKKYHLNSNKRMKIWKNSWVIVCRTSVCCDAEWIRNVFDIKWTFYNMLCVMFIAAKSCVEHLLCVTGWWSGRKWTRAIERWKMGRTEQERRRKSGCRGVWSIKCSMLYMFDDVFTFCMRVSMQKAKHEPNI